MTHSFFNKSIVCKNSFELVALFSSKLLKCDDLYLWYILVNVICLVGEVLVMYAAAIFWGMTVSKLCCFVLCIMTQGSYSYFHTSGWAVASQNLGYEWYLQDKSLSLQNIWQAESPEGVLLMCFCVWLYSTSSSSSHADMSRSAVVAKSRSQVTGRGFL